MFNRGRFGWEELAFSTPGRLLALARWMAKQEDHRWQAMAQHALSCVEDEGYDLWRYQAEFFPEKAGRFFLASDEQMRTFWDFIENPVTS